VNNTTTTNEAFESIFAAQEYSGQVYSPKILQQRLKEEMLRSNRTHHPFLYVRIPTKQFDVFGLEHKNSLNVKAWEIAVLTLLGQTGVLDIKGYLEDEQGIGIVFLDTPPAFVQTLKREILRNLRAASLLDKIKLKPSHPLFQVFYYSGEVESQRMNTHDLMQTFSHINEGFFGIKVLQYSDLTLNRWNKRLITAIKRSIDIAGALAGIIVLSPLLILLGVLVKLSDPKGSVFFSQTRVGQNGSLFTMYKYRSMYSDAEERLQELMDKNEAEGPVFKIKNDPRVFPFGKMIRKYSLDELPQLWNILLGDMAIVGPRPPLPAEVQEYLPWHKMRLAVRPGLTCHWQVSGRSNVGFDDWMRLDNKYVRHGDLSTDMQLIRKTFSAVLKGDGAY
jgi:lipopolysaccharide/colanic/teichoic acid biosynthesis glycosyltransferase